MSRTSVSILALTESCVSKFDKLLASYTPDSQRIESLESRLADFNLWADGVGALAKPGASLDSRLQRRVNDLALVKNVLIMLVDSLDHCMGLAKDTTNYDETDHQEAIQNLDSAIKNLALIGVAIRRTGQASRNRRADKTFNPDNHQELRTHLECIIRLRPTEEALFHKTDNGEYVAKLDNPKLSDIQNRLVEANLRRRHKFLIAQKRSRIQKILQIRPSIPEAPSSADSVPKEEPLADMRNADAAKNQNPTPYLITRGQETTAPTISRFSLASTAEGTLKYAPAARKYTPSITKTQITFIASDAEFPKAPSIPLGREIIKCPCCCQSLPIETFQNPKLWKQHIVEDLCPYTCIADNCPTPQLLFCTRNEWESHVKKTHLPRWQCPFCEEQNEDYSTMESMGCHLQDVHGEELLDNSLATLLSWSAVQTIGIKSCPLCSSSGPEDSPELVDHVLRHAYDFALRALPWPQPIVYDVNILPGSFTLPKGSDHIEDLQRWIKEAAHKSVGPPEIQLSDYDREDHSVTVPTNLFEYSDYFLTNTYFDDKSEDRSSKLQFDQSNASAYSTMSAQSHITSRVEDSVAFSADGRQVASASRENVINLWNIETGKITKRFKGHNSEISLVAFSPCGQQLASASVQPPDAPMPVMATKQQAEEVLRKLEQMKKSGVLPNNPKYIKASQFLLNFQQQYHMRRSQQQMQQNAQAVQNGNVNGVNGTSVDCYIKIWDIETEVCVKMLMGHNENINSIVFSPNSQQLASASDDRTVKIWDTTTGQCVQTLGTHVDIHAITSVAFSPNGQQLASSGSLHGGRIWIWDIKKGRLGHTLAGQMDAVNSLAFSPNGQELVSASCDGSVMLWDMETGECKWTSKGHYEQITSVAYSPNGRQLASASLHGTIRIWDVATGACAMAFEDHGAKISSIIISPGSKQLLSASDDNAIRVWDMVTGTCIKTLTLKEQNTEHIEGHKYHTHSDYTVGWVCALPKEQLAALYMLEHKHEDLPNPADDNNKYMLGSIGGHNIVVACPLISRADKNDAKTISQMVLTFPNIKACLMVGTGSGIPPEVRLGDVVVSCAQKGQPAVLEWDMEKDEPLKRTGHLSDPPTVALLRALSRFQADPVSYTKLFSYLNDVESRDDVPRHFVKSHLPEDLLFKPGYNHVSRIPDSYDMASEEDDCRLCDKSMIVDRPPRVEKVIIHYGPVASGNRVIRDVNFHERLKEFNANILCVGTETAHLMNDFPCVVIRGICDYADSHKNKAWQEYAAVTAAACAKALLTVLSVDDVDKMEAIKDIVPLDVMNNSAQEYDTREMTQSQAEHDEAHVDDDDTKLHDAIKNRNTDAVKFLLSQGASVQARDKHGDTPLHHAARTGQVGVAELLLNHGAHVEAENNEEETPLHLAVLKGEDEIVEWLLKHGADIEAMEENGYTPLHCAVITGQVDIAELLLNHGADVEAENNIGETPLHHAARSGHVVIAEFLLNHGADVNARDSDEETPLQLAAWSGHVGVAEFLLNHGADVKAKTSHGETPLHLAALEGEEEMAELLLDHGNDIEAKDNANYTPLHRAAGFGHVGVAEFLLKQGANINAKDGEGDTPLHKAILKEFKDVVKLLLGNGADIEAKNNNGKTPLHLTAKEGYVDIAKLLLNRGANTEAEDEDGNTALSIAMHNGEDDIVKLLREQSD